MRMPARTCDVMKSVMWWLLTPVRWGFMPASQTLAPLSLIVPMPKKQWEHGRSYHRRANKMQAAARHCTAAPLLTQHSRQLLYERRLRFNATCFGQRLCNRVSGLV